MAKKNKNQEAKIIDPKVAMLSLDQIELNPENPKKPLSKDRKRGLNRSLDHFGFCGAILVAPHPTDSDKYIILDGNTRYEEMSKKGASRLPCIILDHIDTPAKIKEFVITYDRNTKAYNEDAVLGQLRSLISEGEDVDLLSDLANIPELDSILFDPTDKTEGFVVESVEERDSLLITGTRDEIDGIRAALRTIRGKMDVSQKVKKMLSLAEEIDWDDDEEMLLVLLMALSHMADAPVNVTLSFQSPRQKTLVFDAVKRRADAEGYAGEFAVARALEDICLS